MAPRLSPRVFAVGFGQNVASFLAWSVIPLWSVQVGKAETWQMGMLAAVSGVVYIFTALRAGPLSDRVGRGRMARAGLVLFALFCVLAWWARSVTGFIALGAVNGFAMALVWPGLQASIGDASTADDLERNLGAFSLSWSAGKTAGFLASALAYGELGLDALILCGALSLLLAPLLPGGRSERHADAPPLVRDDHHPPALRAAHLRVGWFANFAGYGMGSTMVYLYPKLVVAAGRPEREHGFVLGAVFLAQTVGFWLFGRYAGWRYRFAPVACWLGIGAAALLVLGFRAPLPVAIPAGLVLGLALGQAYMASVYYSVHSEKDRGARAGIHEAIIGAGDFGIPLLGGYVAYRSDWIPASYLLAAAVAGLAILAAGRAVRGAPRPA